MMPLLRSVPSIFLRATTGVLAGAVLLALGWLAMGGRDIGSTLIAFPLLSFGSTLVLVSLGAVTLAIRRHARGEALGPLAAPVPLPRAVARRRSRS